MQESLPLGGRKVDEDVDELDEGRRVAGVAQLGLSVPYDVLSEIIVINWVLYVRQTFWVKNDSFVNYWTF